MNRTKTCWKSDEKNLRHGKSAFLGTLLLLCLGLVSGPASGLEPQTQTENRTHSTTSPEAFKAAADKSRALVASRLAEGVPGFSVAVSVNGETVLEHAEGVVDLETKAPVTANTQFRIGSTSKSLTSALAARLVEAGLVDLDLDIRTYLPSFPEKRWVVTLRDLLSNQSGVRHYKGIESFNQRHYDSLEDALVIFQDDPLAFEPHSNVKYSSYGFNLAGAVMVAAAGLPFEELLKQQILQPLGMTATAVDDATAEFPQRATFYSQRANGPFKAMAVDDSYKAPSGGLISTPTHVLKFGQGLLTGLDAEGKPWLRKETIEMLFTPRKIADGRTAGYALGFRVQEKDAEAEPPKAYAVHHGGSSIGGRSMFYLLPEEGVVVSLVVNSDGYDTKEDDAAAIGKWFSEAKPTQ